MKKALISLSILILAAFSLASPVIIPGDAVPCASAVYHGNVNTKKFHKQSCRYFDCKACTRVFHSREDAINAGYVPCKVCKP